MLRPILFSALLLIVNASCKKNEVIAHPIDSTISLWASEDLRGEDRILKLEFSTEKIYPYTYFIIEKEVDFNESERSITIKLTRIIEPRSAQAAFARALTIHEIENISNGDYDFTVIINDTPHLGQLSVTTDLYQLEFEQTEELITTEPTRHRIPKNTLWGRVNYGNSEDLEYAENFIDALEIADAIEKTFLPGNYWYFKIDDDGAIAQPGGHSIAFIVGHSGNTKKMEAVIRSFRTNHPQLMIRATTDLGEQI